MVVEEPSQLVGQDPNRPLRALGSVDPVEVDAGQLRVDVGYGLDLLQTLEQIAQLVLLACGQQEVVERLEAAALVRLADAVTATEDVVEQLALRARPLRDSLPHLAVEPAEVLLHLP